MHILVQVLGVIFGAMASLFRRGSSEIWQAKVRLWDARAGKWVWRSRTTWTKDKEAAAEVAEEFERVSGAAKSGSLTHDQVRLALNHIISLAGGSEQIQGKTLRDFVTEFLRRRLKRVSSSTARKYSSHWTQASRSKTGLPIESEIHRITKEDIQKYYDHLCDRLSSTTANDHLRSIRMWFEKAKDEGLIRANPAAMVERLDNDSVERETLSRSDVSASIRTMRKAGRRDWAAFALLGWHTGQRIQDCLAITSEAITDGVWRFTPEKKKKRKRVIALPLPKYLASLIESLGNLQTIHNADNRNGRVSSEFCDWLRLAGVDTLPTVRGARTVQLKSFHSFRHSMSTRLAAAGVPGDLARMVTDHESERVSRGYQHRDIDAIRGALKLLKRK